MTTVLWDVRLVDPATAEVHDHRTITMEAGMIAAVGEAAGTAPDGARDLAGATVLPGEPELLDVMAEQGTVLVPTLSTFHDLAERFASEFAAPLVEQAKRQLDEALRTVVAARSAGVTIALGYDSGPPGASANELVRLVEAGLSPMEALRAATTGGAAALGRPELGRIAVGGPADVVVVDGRPDEDVTTLTEPDLVIDAYIGGRPTKGA